MKPLTCATCKSVSLKPPRMLAGAWYALCTQCLFETEVEPADGAQGEARAVPAAGGAVRPPQTEAQPRTPGPARVA